MGCCSSKEVAQDFQLLTELELKDFRTFFETVTKHRGQSCLKSDLEVSWSYIDERLLKMLMIFYFKNKKSITFEEFISLPIHIVKGSQDDKVYQMIKLANGNKTDGNTTLSDFIQYVSSIVLTYIKIMDYIELEEYMSWKQVCSPINESKIDEYATWLCEDLVASMKNIFSVEDISDWYRKAYTFGDMQLQIFQQLFQMVDNGEFGTLIPLFLDRQQVLRRDKSLLDIISILFLKSYILNAEKDYWQILYSTVVHGVSLVSLVDQIQSKGPTLLIIKDNDNYVFGGYASESWKMDETTFYGNAASFLFTLRPQMKVYRSSGQNNNFQYLAFRRRNIRNGLGFGGKRGHFGIWIDEDGVNGECNAKCSTYSNAPRLSLRKNFIIMHLEVWGFGFSSRQQSLAKAKRASSVLMNVNSGNFDASSVFGLTGRTFHSQNFPDLETYFSGKFKMAVEGVRFSQASLLEINEIIQEAKPANIENHKKLVWKQFFCFPYLK